MQWVDYFPQNLACQLIASAAGYGPKLHFVALEMARLSLLKLPIKIFYGLEFLGIASASGIDRGATLSKSYRDFGYHDRLAPSPADLMHHGMNLL